MSRRPAVFDGIGLPDPMTFSTEAAQIGLKSRELDMEQQQFKAKQAAQAKDAQDKDKKDAAGLYDPNKNLQATPWQSQQYNGISDLQKQAYDLSKLGYSSSQIMGMLQPEANKVNESALKGKTALDLLNKQLQEIPDNQGYNKKGIYDEAVRSIYFNPDGTLKKDLIDLDLSKNYVDEALANNPLGTTDYSGIQNFLTKQMTNAKPDVREVVTVNGRGGTVKKNLEVTAPDWMVLDNDSKGNSLRQLVPEWEYATDDEDKVMHKFKDGNNVSEEPIRMVTDRVYDMVSKNNPAYLANLRGQVGQYIDKAAANGMIQSYNSQQVKNLTKALMYDDLKLMNKGGVKDIVETKEPKITINNNSGGGKNDDTKINDIYNRIYAKTQANDAGIFASKNFVDKYQHLGFKEGSRIGTRMNALNADEQKVIFDLFGGRNENMNETNTFIGEDKNGDMVLYKTDENNNPIPEVKNAIGVINKTGTNIKVQPNSKAKVEVVKQGEGTHEKSNISSYPENIQNGIRAFMKANNLSEQQAIQALKKARKI